MRLLATFIKDLETSLPDVINKTTFGAKNIDRLLKKLVDTIFGSSGGNE